MAFGQLRAPISGIRSNSYAGLGGRGLTDPTGERRKRQFRQRFRGLQSCRPNSFEESGFKKHPIGAGPYKFVSFTPGIELVMEANEGYWRKTPSVKRLVFRSIPDESTRLAALKGGEVDIAYSIRGELAEEMLHTPGL